jgi:hypothetical protein
VVVNTIASFNSSRVAPACFAIGTWEVTALLYPYSHRQMCSVITEKLA